MAKAFLAMIHRGQRRSEGLYQSEPWSSLKYMMWGYFQKFKSDAAGLENPSWSGGVGMWQECIDRRLRIAMFMLRSMEQNNFCNIIGMLLMYGLRFETNAGGKAQGPLWCVLSTLLSPSASYFNDDFKNSVVYVLGWSCAPLCSIELFMENIIG